MRTANFPGAGINGGSTEGLVPSNVSTMTQMRAASYRAQ